jgi:hypothetical protein
LQSLFQCTPVSRRKNRKLPRPKRSIVNEGFFTPLCRIRGKTLLSLNRFVL